MHNFENHFDRKNLSQVANNFLSSGKSYAATFCFLFICLNNEMPLKHLTARSLVFDLWEPVFCSFFVLTEPRKRCLRKKNRTVSK